MNIFIGFLGFTNDAVIENVIKEDISALDESVLNALDIPDVSQNEIYKTELSNLELLVEEQKRIKKLSNSSVIKRLSITNDLSILIENSQAEDILNESFPEHFHLMKVEDELNESRPRF